MSNFKEYDVIIIGAGLTGLTLAYLLSNQDTKVLIVEARDRLGGRIYTLDENKSQIEMGATWLGSKHQSLINLLGKLHINYFPQQIGEHAIYEAISTSPPYLATLPHNPDPTLRITNGSISLINSLAGQLTNTQINLGEKVISIKKIDKHLQLTGTGNNYKAKYVISTLPPNLFINTITCAPELPNKVSELCQSTHTWMSESIKIALSYDKPFWRQEGLSGTVFSNVGPIPEMYDHSNFQDNTYALMGFLNGNYHISQKKQRKALVLNQLRKYYGNIVDSYLNYHEQVWNQESETYFPYSKPILPHQNNGDQLYQQSYLDNSLLIAGTETAKSYPGYMEGAIISAQTAYEWVNNNLEAIT